MLALFFLSGGSHLAASQEADSASATPPPLNYIIYDSSNSMWGEIEGKQRKYEAARIALAEYLHGDLGDREIALRAYGHRSKDDCQDSELIVPPTDAASARTAVLSEVDKIRPMGRTPITYSLSQALDDFNGRSGSIILITDGIESCSADPCALLAKWREQEVNINVHVVGFGLSEKEKTAMQCMSEASGTQFRDAQSAAELSEELTAIDHIEKERAKESEFRFDVRDDKHNDLHVGHGVLEPKEGGDAIDVATHSRYVLPIGEYRLSAGILTKDGKPYRPVTMDVTILPYAKNRPVATSPLPPRVSARFLLDDTEVPIQASIEAHQNGDKLWEFKRGEEVFAAPGAYEFRSSPDRANQDLQVEATIEHGKDQVLSFQLQKSVKVRMRFLAAESGIRYRANGALFRDGEEIWNLHSNNFFTVTPGSYEVRFETALSRFSAPIEITSEPKQDIEIEVPSGHLTVHYFDHLGNRETPKRVRIRPVDRKGRGIMRRSDEKIALTPGTYEIIGWPAKNGYAPQSIEIKAGDDFTLELRATV